MRRRQIYQRQEKPPEKTIAEKYQEKFGKPPHHRMKPETIQKAVENGDSGDGCA